MVAARPRRSLANLAAADYSRKNCMGRAQSKSENGKDVIMKPTWEVRDYDREFFEKELDSFVPDKIFDAHAHLYRKSHWGRPTAVDSTIAACLRWWST